jgi:hypothetical protein
MKPARQVVKPTTHRSVGIVNASWFQPASEDGPSRRRSIQIERGCLQSFCSVAMTVTEESGIVHESELEAAFVRLAILCPAVLSIQAQPFRLDWIDEDGIARQYVPDYLVTLSDRHRVAVEVSISSCSEGSQWLPPFPWFARTSTVQSRGGTLRSWPALP